MCEYLKLVSTVLLFFPGFTLQWGVDKEGGKIYASLKHTKKITNMTLSNGMRTRNRARADEIFIKLEVP